ncbi:redox-sensitive transcriptional activator SoxR [Hoeflea sp. YIM 152468]|uniref:redox-sensitive transcriptional activator SoxR n=1 Tax=Hoeflea sp. YIM 152468 TaxID=3031759 RepID=UPI0023DB1650|nr:redox-sensitive transcriptional activator SoxR [Hoeflea sp. YIM 152468]MDF1609703.1 redox-sensitive transcriptional activator SoxR [Hoeflea sp. YIM 152468]
MPANTNQRLLSIGEVAARTGLAVSAIRYYDDEGLVSARRTPGGKRMFLRSDIRRLSFILIAQQLGFSLEDIRIQLRQLPLERTPNKRDWEKISRGFRAHLDARIGMLERLRDRLDGCIGCGCLSLDACKLYNPGDKARERGPGPRLVLEQAVADRKA